MLSRIEFSSTPFPATSSWILCKLIGRGQLLWSTGSPKDLSIRLTDLEASLSSCPRIFLSLALLGLWSVRFCDMFLSCLAESWVTHLLPGGAIQNIPFAATFGLPVSLLCGVQEGKEGTQLPVPSTTFWATSQDFGFDMSHHFISAGIFNCGTAMATTVSSSCQFVSLISDALDQCFNTRRGTRVSRSASRPPHPNGHRDVVGRPSPRLGLHPQPTLVHLTSWTNFRSRLASKALRDHQRV